MIKLKNIKAIIFDFDGVIADSTSRLAGILTDIYSKSDKTYSYKQVHGDMKTFYNEYKNSHPSNKKELTLSEFADEITFHPASKLTPSNILDGIIPLINFSKENNIKIAIATNSPKKRMKIAIKELELTNTFDYICTPDDVSFPKPNPDMIINCMNWLESKPEETLFIDDSEIAIQAGIEAGTKTALLTKQNKKDIANKKITYIINQINELDLTEI